MAGLHSTELSDFVRAYERCQNQEGGAPLKEFLPEPCHPLYLTVLREMVCIDLEYGWKRKQPRPLESYRLLVPELFADPESMREVALQEYRLRLEAGQRPTPLEYQQQYGVDTTDWPRPSAAQHEIQPRAIEEPPSSLHSFHGSHEHAELFLHAQCSDSGTTDRLAQCTTALPEPGTEFLGFRLLKELGRGAFARVYLCQQGELANRYVVLKVSTHTDVESQTLAQLQHTNVVPIYSVHRAGSLQAVCMPYFGSTTLSTVLKDLRGRQSLPVSGKGLISTLVDRNCVTHLKGPETSDPIEYRSEMEVAQSAQPLAATLNIGSTSILEMLEDLSYVEAILWIMARVTDGLAHAHERGILHRDLKPANILLTDEGQPMLLDFNLAQDTKVLADSSAALVGGTLPFMAPEQLVGYRAETCRGDHRSDLYALGVILYELLTGRLPFESHTGPLSHVLERMIADRLQPPPSVRRWNAAVTLGVESIVKHCLEPNPSKRYQSAREMQEDLERQLDHQPLRYVAEASWRERVGKWVYRHPRLTSSSSVAVVAAMLIVLLCCSLGLRMDRLARLEAAESLSTFQEDMRTAQFLLTARAADAEQLEAGAQQARKALDRYDAIDNPSWYESAGVRRLAPEDRSRLREDVGQLLLLLAQGTMVQASGEPNAVDQEERLSHALHLNRRAETCSTTVKSSRALLLQRAELVGLLDKDAPADRLKDEANSAPVRSPADYYLLATAHIAHGRYRQALPLLEEATLQDPQHFWAWFSLGNCYENLSQDPRAIACYSACMGMRPKFAWTYFNRGLAHLRQRDLKHACADFDQVILLRPLLADAYINRALARQGLANYQAAIEDLTTALELGAPYARIYFMRSRAHEKAGNREAARRDWEEGLRQEPTDEKSWIARGMAHLTKDARGALADFRKALRINPRSLAALQNVAHVHSKLDENEKAVQILDKTVRLHPDYVPARIGRGVILARLGKRALAHEDVRETVLRDNSASTLYQAGCIYALTSRKVAADRAEAYRFLASALWKGYGLDLLDKDKDLAPIRNEPEFRRLAERARAFHASVARTTTKPN
jgi:serine/threonine protein kinase/tetratricopeptide (TPR) repeat protein